MRVVCFKIKPTNLSQNYKEATPPNILQFVLEETELIATWNLKFNLEKLSVKELYLKPGDILPVSNFNLEKDSKVNIVVYEIFGYK